MSDTHLQLGASGGDDSEAEEALADMPPFNAQGYTAEVPVMESQPVYRDHLTDNDGLDPIQRMHLETDRRDAERRTRPPNSAIDGHRPDSNPKSALGIKKVPLHLVSPISILHEAMAMAEGGMKYGPYNYRMDKVAATVYCAAALRHIFDWMCGEEMARDSNIHHLGHAKACCGIILDAQATGSLIDDRYKTDAYRELLDMYTAMLPAMAERIEAMSKDLEAHNR